MFSRNINVKRKHETNLAHKYEPFNVLLTGAVMLMLLTSHANEAYGHQFSVYDGPHMRGNSRCVCVNTLEFTGVNSVAPSVHLNA